MGSKFAQASVAVGAAIDKQSFRRAKSDITASVKGIGTSIGGILGPALAASIGAAGIGAILSKTIGLAREQIVAERKLEAVIKATGGAAGFTAGELKQYAAELQKVSSYGDELTISAMGTLATFREIKGGVFKEAIKAAQDMSAVLGTDLQSSVLQLGKALNDPIKGITALSRAGVSFTEQQKEMIKSLQDSGRLMEAQQVILAELKGEFSGAARAMSDPWTQLKNSLGDLGEEIGKNLIPYLDQMAVSLKDNVEQAIKLSDATGKVGPGEDWTEARGNVFSPGPKMGPIDSVVETGNAVRVGVALGHDLGNLDPLTEKTPFEKKMIRQKWFADQARFEQQRKERAEAEKLAEATAKFQDEMNRPPEDRAELLGYMEKLDRAVVKVGESAKRTKSDLGEAIGAIAEELRVAGLSDQEKRLDKLWTLGTGPEELDLARQMMEATEGIKKRKAAEAKAAAEWLPNLAERAFGFLKPENIGAAVDARAERMRQEQAIGAGFGGRMAALVKHKPEEKGQTTFMRFSDYAKHLQRAIGGKDPQKETAKHTEAIQKHTAEAAGRLVDVAEKIALLPAEIGQMIGRALP